MCATEKRVCMSRYVEKLIYVRQCIIDMATWREWTCGGVLFKDFAVSSMEVYIDLIQRYR